MTMSLTKDDLKSIKSIVDDSIDGLAISTAQGFEEVHKKIDGVEIRLVRRLGTVETSIKNLTIRQEETLGLMLQQDDRITKLETAVK